MRNHFYEKLKKKIGIEAKCPTFTRPNVSIMHNVTHLLDNLIPFKIVFYLTIDFTCPFYKL